MEVKPFKDREDSRKNQVRDMFNQIADQYDFLNHFLSLNTDKRWRRKLVRKVKEEVSSKSWQSFSILDVATGTGDLAFAMGKIQGAEIISYYSGYRIKTNKSQQQS